MEDDEYGGPEVACKWSGSNISTGQLAQLRYTGKGPKFYKPTPKTVLYKKSEFMSWIEQSARIQTSRLA